VTDAQQRAKEAAGRKAAEYVRDGMKVGLGTGSTVHYTIVALGERHPDIICVATSERTAALAMEFKLKVVAPDEALHLDIAIDGADEVDGRFNLIKGGGGAHTREKVVANMAARFLVVADESKLVETLGAFGLPLEVLPFAPAVVAEQVRALGAARITTRAVRSDNGNLLMDAAFPRIADPITLAGQLAAIPGLVEHGLFLAPMVERVIVAGTSGVRELVNARAKSAP
jgi:ribose 5-phosphate isomerase A